MNDRIRALLNQITALKNDLQTALQEQQSSMFFQIKGKRASNSKAPSSRRTCGSRRDFSTGW